MKGYKANQDTYDVASINVSGNIVPTSWFHHITNKRGQPDSRAILLYAELVYWYRPVSEEKGKSSNAANLRKKYKADKVQISYGQLAVKFGYSKGQVRTALRSLQDLNLIKLDFRVLFANGMYLNNVLYIALNIARLREITYMIENSDEGSDEGEGKSEPPHLRNQDRGTRIHEEGIDNMSREEAENHDTYTETTLKLHKNNTKNSTETTEEEGPSSVLARNLSDETLIELLENESIGNPKRAEILSRSEMSAEFFEEVKAKWEASGRPGDAGGLINRLLETRPKLSDEQERRKYFEGEFEDFINH